MPSEFQPTDPTWPARRTAWVAHYVAKGCTVFKAGRLAEKKRHKSSTPMEGTEHG